MENDMVNESDENDDIEAQIIAVELASSRGQSVASPLHSLENRVRQRLTEEQEKIDIMHTKRDVERAHSQYLQQNVSDAWDLREARQIAQGWAKQNANKHVPKVRVAVPPRTAALDSGAVQLECPVINCSIKFSDGCKKQEHIREFRHSPCNPYLLSPDGSSGTERFFCCPQCQHRSQDMEACLEHMISSSHLDAGEPVEMSGFVCPMCLNVFASEQDCREHMADLKHHNYLYPFPDDPRTDNAAPVPIPAVVAKEFARLCSIVAWSLECAGCGRKLLTTEDYLIHRQQTQCHNMVMALADATVADVFTHFLKSCCCSECRCLMDVLEGATYGSEIICNHGNKALLMENDCRSFCELLCRSVLPKLPHSLDVNIEQDSGKQDNHSQVNNGERQIPAEVTPIVITESPDRMSVCRNTSLVSHNVPTEDNVPNHRAVVPPVDTSSQSVLKVFPAAATARTEFTASPLKRLMPGESNGSHIVPAKRMRPLDTRLISNDNINRSAIAESTSRLATNFNYSLRQAANLDHLSRWATDLNHSSRLATHFNHSSNLGPIAQSTSPKQAEDLNRCSEQGHAQIMDRSTKHKSITEPQNLSQMKHIIFLDLDNWVNFFGHLPTRLPDQTFVWAFYGGRLEWREPRQENYHYLKRNGWFQLHEKCGFTKDAADFALTLAVGRMDERLPKHIPFTVISGDRGFCEVERQMRNSERRAVVINPHRQTKEMIFSLIKSVEDV